MKLGDFTKTEDGAFVGTIETFTLKAELRIVPVEKTGNEDSPNYRVYDENRDVEIGAGWKRKSRNDNNYAQLRIDDPTFPQPISPVLYNTDEGYQMHWTRPSKSKAGNGRNAETDEL